MKNKYNVLINELDKPTINFSVFEKSSININNLHIDQKKIKSFFDEIVELNMFLKTQQIDGYYKFSEYLKKQIFSIGFNNDLFQEGFFDLDLYLTQQFIKNDFFEWGGFYSKKVDFMHFGFKNEKVKDLINK